MRTPIEPITGYDDIYRVRNALNTLRKQQLENQYYAPNMQSEIDNRNALKKKITTMTPLEAMELSLKNQYYPALTESQIKAQEAMANFRNAGGSGMGVDQKLIMGLGSQLRKDHPEWNDSQVNEAANAYLSGQTALGDGTELPPITGQTRQLLDVMLKKSSSTQGLNQQRYAATAENLLSQGEPYLDSIAKYSGILGTARGNIDAVRNVLGEDTPDYQDYLYFTRAIVPAAASEFMRAMGVNASDTQKQLYMDVVNPTNWDTAPQTAIKNYKRMLQLMKSVGSIVRQSPSEIRQTMMQQGQKSEAKQQYVTIRNNKTGETKRITVEEARRLQARGL